MKSNFKFIKSIIVAVMLAICSVTSYAYDFEVDGIYYNLLSPAEFTCGVACTPSGKEYIGEIGIPSSVSYKGKTIKVVSIDMNAFKGCESLKSVVIPNSVTSIGESAFGDCKSLESVAIPNSVAYIGKNAFKGCASLKSVAIPNSVTSIGEDAFNGCASLKSVAIPNSVTSIGKFAFYDCKSLESVAIPNSITTIELGTFLDCASLKSVAIPNSVTSIGGVAFDGCRSLESVVISNSVKSISFDAFSGCMELKSVIFEDGKEYLSYTYDSDTNPFPNSTLTYVYLGRQSNWSSASRNLILYMGGNSTLEIGYHVVEMYIDGRDNLKLLISHNPVPPKIQSFSNTQYMNLEVRVPAEALEAYKEASIWENFWNMKAIEDSGVDEVEDEKSPVEIGRFNLQGQSVDDGYQGVVIVRYGDGTSRKVLQ